MDKGKPFKIGGKYFTRKSHIVRITDIVEGDEYPVKGVYIGLGPLKDNIMSWSYRGEWCIGEVHDRDLPYRGE